MPIKIKTPATASSTAPAPEGVIGKVESKAETIKVKTIKANGIVTFKDSRMKYKENISRNQVRIVFMVTEGMDFLVKHWDAPSWKLSNTCLNFSGRNFFSLFLNFFITNKRIKAAMKAREANAR